MVRRGGANEPKDHEEILSTAFAGRPGKRASRIVAGEIPPRQAQWLAEWVRSKAKTGVGPR